MNFVDKDGTTKVYIPVHLWPTQFQSEIIARFGTDLYFTEIYKMTIYIYIDIRMFRFFLRRTLYVCVATSVLFEPILNQN